jgi:hypothetical protein
LPRGHAVLAFVDVAVGFVDRTADVGVVGFLRIYGFYVSASASLLRSYRLESSQMRFLRHKLGNTRLDLEGNKSVREKLGVRNTVLEIEQYP